MLVSKDSRAGLSPAGATQYHVQTPEEIKMSAQSPADAAEQAAEQVKVAAEAYIYGYPLVYNLHEMADFASGSPRFPVQAPYNTFGHARALAGPGMKFVSPNNDTCYSLAVCDVCNGPLVLHVPDRNGTVPTVARFEQQWNPQTQNGSPVIMEYEF